MEITNGEQNRSIKFTIQIILITTMVRGSQGGEYEDGCFLGCSAEWTGLSFPALQRSYSPQSDRTDDGGSTDLRNAGKLTPVYMALQPRKQPSSLF
jgi:hypothetical protein